jgi:hypothetical protein
MSIKLVDYAIFTIALRFFIQKLYRCAIRNIRILWSATDFNGWCEMEESKKPEIQTFDEILLEAEKNRTVLRPMSGRSVKGKSNRKNNSLVEFIINTGETAVNPSGSNFQW